MGLITQLKFSRTSLITVGLIGFLAGLGLARLKINIAGWQILPVLPLALLSVKSKNLLALLAVGCLAIAIGLWRGQNYLKQLAAYQPLYGHKVTLVGMADNDGSYAKGSQLSFDVSHLRLDSSSGAILTGKIGVKGYGENAVFRGDQVIVAGKLYPARSSRQGSLSYANITVIKHSTSSINSLRRRFQAGMLSALPEPMASFALGLLIGDRSTLPAAVNDDLSTAGLTHVVAVSGYNLTIIAGGVYFLLKKFSKYQATLISVALVLLFIIFAGASASIIRAAIVSMLSLWAGYFGRNFKPLLLVLLAAALTAGWSPTYLWSDIGWYLSFLAFFGILVLAPLLISRLSRKKRASVLALVVAESMSAQLMTIPIVMYIFGQISLVALPANILVVPLVPLAMLLAFLAALAGMLLPAIAGWLAWPARLLLTYLLDIVRLMSKVPHALSRQSLSLAQVIWAYALVLLICALLWLRSRSKAGIITDIKG
ncbi:MAG: ComEC/Rec2 family competence protein [Candidatus Saccharimonadales bacterium]